MTRRGIRKKEKEENNRCRRGMIMYEQEKRE